MTQQIELDKLDRQVEELYLRGIRSKAEIMRKVLGDPEGSTDEEKAKDYNAKYQKISRSLERIKKRWKEGWTYEDQASLDEQRYQRIEELYEIVREAWDLAKKAESEASRVGALNAVNAALREVSELQGLRAKIIKVEGGLGIDFSTASDEDLDRELAKIQRKLDKRGKGTPAGGMA